MCRPGCTILLFTLVLESGLLGHFHHSQPGAASRLPTVLHPSPGWCWSFPKLFPPLPPPASNCRAKEQAFLYTGRTGGLLALGPKRHCFPGVQPRPSGAQAEAKQVLQPTSPAHQEAGKR